MTAASGPAMPPGPFGYAIRHWRQYRRLRRAGGAVVAGGFAGYIADTLRVDGPGPLVRALAQHTLRRG